MLSARNGHAPGAIGSMRGVGRTRMTETIVTFFRVRQYNGRYRPFS